MKEKEKGELKKKVKAGERLECVKLIDHVEGEGSR